MNDSDQEATGRINQKARTRAALMESAVALIREGRRPTVEEAALAAGISKRTAYRYFVSQDHLLADAALESLREDMDQMFAAISDSADVYARITTLAVALRRLSETHDSELRVMMRASLDRKAGPNAAAPAQRGGRRLEWIERALLPVRDQLSAERHTRLVNSLAVCLGVDAVIVLRDVCGVTGQAADDEIVWMATTMVDRALVEAKGSARP